MTVTNGDIAAMFRKLAELLSIEDANPFRIRAYRQAAQVIDAQPRPVASMLAEGADLSDLPGIGDDLADKIATIVATGDLPLLDAVMARTPPVLTDLLAVPGLGPRRVEQLYDSLGIETLDDLALALRAHRVAALRGFSDRTEASLLGAVRGLQEKGPGSRLPIATARPVARALLTYLRGYAGVIRVEMAGSYRRRRETVGDLDMVAAADDAAGVIRHFGDFGDVRRVTLRGITRSTVVLKSGLHVDLRVVRPDSFGTALAYFTGARSHTIALRKLAVKNGWKLNEYGLFDSAGKVLAGPDEAGLYKAFGMQWIAPELREMGGELAAATRHALPVLANGDDIRGDPHVGTTASSLSAQIAAARARGHRWIGIADPVRRPGAAGGAAGGAARGAGGGLSAQGLLRQIAEIDRLNAADPGFHVFKSAVVAIGPDGDLQIADKLLHALDYAVCYLPDPASDSRANSTWRLLRAMDQGPRLLLARASGRGRNGASAAPVDLGPILTAARRHGHLIEVCARPDWLGLSDRECRLAKSAGAGLALVSAADDPAGLAAIDLGLWQARRGWIAAADLANSRRWDRLLGDAASTGQSSR